MADLLTSIRAEIDARLRELRPAVAEYERLNTAAGALVAEDRAAARPARRAASKPAGRAAAAPAGRTVSQPARRTAAGPVGRTASRPVRAPAGAAGRKKTSAAKGARGTRKREQPAHTPVGQAILAALEHGSHTLAELVTVTALSASDIREALRRLRTRGAIVKTDRDGKAAYALPAAGDAE
jgi:hypothetical protein